MVWSNWSGLQRSNIGALSHNNRRIRCVVRWGNNVMRLRKVSGDDRLGSSSRSMTRMGRGVTRDRGDTELLANVGIPR